LTAAEIVGLEDLVRHRILCLVASLGVLILTGCPFPFPQPGSERETAPALVVEERPFHFTCEDRWPGMPETGRTPVMLVSSPQAPYLRTHLEQISLSRAEVPALTIAAESSGSIQIAGGKSDDWSLHSCAAGEGETDDEARRYLEKVTVSRLGGLLTVSGTENHGPTGDLDTLLAEVPTGAPVTVHASYSPVEVHETDGPVRVTATGARAVFLNTTGQVDAAAALVDFVGSRGRVMLNAEMDISVKLTETRFDGNLRARAERAVRVFVPSGFANPMRAVVSRPKDFVCRAEFCSKFTEGRDNTWYTFSDPGEGDAAEKNWLTFQSEQAAVEIDTDTQGQSPEGK
jgi:hypothetical protein